MNTASRLESQGLVGRIRVTAEAFQRIQADDERAVAEREREEVIDGFEAAGDGAGDDGFDFPFDAIDHLSGHLRDRHGPAVAARYVDVGQPGDAGALLAVEATLRGSLPGVNAALTAAGQPPVVPGIAELRPPRPVE